MTIVDRLKLRTGDDNEALLADCVESARVTIMSLRYPFRASWPEEVEPRYQDLQFRMALDLYNKIGAEGEINHIENGISRTYQSSWFSADLLAEITPICGVSQ